jgi:hypothetical protein
LTSQIRAFTREEKSMLLAGHEPCAGYSSGIFDQIPVSLETRLALPTSEPVEEEDGSRSEKEESRSNKLSSKENKDVEYFTFFIRAVPNNYDETR